MKIIIKGEANIAMENHRRDQWFKNISEIRNELTTFEFETEVLEPLETLEIEDNFVDYLSPNLAQKLKSGYTTFQVEKHGGEHTLYSVCTYECKPNQTLTQEELSQLISETQGQWSDGIGEVYEQHAAFEYEDYEFFISCWILYQKVTVNFKD